MCVDPMNGVFGEALRSDRNKCAELKVRLSSNTTATNLRCSARDGTARASHIY